MLEKLGKMRQKHFFGVAPKPWSKVFSEKTLDQPLGASPENTFFAPVFLFFLSFHSFKCFSSKNLKKHTSTRFWSVQHPISGQNI